MTVRDATRRESPDGHVLYIEDLREHLGVRNNASEVSPAKNAPKSRPEVLLVGHDMHDDFKKMEQDGIDLQKHLHYSGCVDTHVIIEDTGERTGKSLGSLAARYDLAEPEFKFPACPSVAGKWSFVGSHCAGNDGVITLEAALGMAFDPSIRSLGAESLDLPEDWLSKPLQGLNANMILLGYDTEGVETPNYKPQVRNRTSEHGFSYLRLAEVAHLAPGEYGRNWRAFIGARHWINKDFRNFTNKFYCVGNPNGFWPEYGRSRYYHVSEGPAPFHELFQELASATGNAMRKIDTVSDVTRAFESTNLGGNASAHAERLRETKGKDPIFGGIPVRGEEFSIRYQGQNKNRKGKMAKKKGSAPSMEQTFAGDFPTVYNTADSGPPEVAMSKGNGVGFDSGMGSSRGDLAPGESINMGRAKKATLYKGDGPDLASNGGKEATEKGKSSSRAPISRDTTLK